MWENVQPEISEEKLVTDEIFKGLKRIPSRLEML